MFASGIASIAGLGVVLYCNSEIIDKAASTVEDPDEVTAASLSARIAPLDQIRTIATYEAVATGVIAVISGLVLAFHDPQKRRRLR